MHWLSLAHHHTKHESGVNVSEEAIGTLWRRIVQSQQSTWTTSTSFIDLEFFSLMSH